MELFLQLNELNDLFLKKAISIIRQRLESIGRNSVQGIEVKFLLEDEKMEENFPVDD